MRTTYVSRQAIQRLGCQGKFRRLVGEQLETRSLLALAVELVADINPGAGSGMLTGIPIAGVGDAAFFAANNGVTGQELWKSDGSAAGTTLVKDIAPGTAGSGAGSLGAIANVNGTLFFGAAGSPQQGGELWKSDGTASGTVLVKDIHVGGAFNSSYPFYLTNVNGTLYFSALDQRGSELWKSDGTEAGTVLVKDILPGAIGSVPSNLVNLNGTLYFSANDGSGNALWKSDGTEAGTVPVISGISRTALSFLANVNGTLFFVANNIATGQEVWKSDGTAAGTMLVKDIVPGLGGSVPASLTNVNGTLFFAATDSVNGRELWQSDGTEAGTVLVKNINLGAGNSSPASLANLNGTLIFSANDGSSGVELWESDGTAAGTMLAADIVPGAGSSSPTVLANVNGRLFFSATNAASGRELWASADTNDPPIANNDSFVASEDTPLTINPPGVLANDIDADGDVITALLASAPAHGTVTLSTNGAFVYTPAANFFGVDSFLYRASDGPTISNVATVTINVAPVNDVPVAIGDDFEAVEDTPLTVPAPGILGNDFDVDGDVLIAVPISTPTQGQLTINVNGSFTYVPAPNFFGVDSFTYRVVDGQAVSNVATVTINIAPVNDIPVAIADDFEAVEDTPLSVAAPGVLGNDFDIDGDILAATLVTNPAQGQVSLNANGSFDYVPAPNFFGVDSFTYRASDGQADSSVATVTINVAPVNDAPVALDDTYGTSQGTPLTVAAPGILANDSDIDGDTLTAALATAPTNGTMTLNADGSFVYTPDSTFAGTDSFAYTISDGSGGTATGIVTIHVAAAEPGSVLTINDSYLGETALLITGTGGNDALVVLQGSGGTTLTVIFNGVISTVPRPSGRIIVTGGAGNDAVLLLGVANTAWLYGDGGNDLLIAGSGGSLVIGGAGNDLLVGGSGRDVLIGGEGADVILGNGNSDLLVAGMSNFDSRSTAGHESFWCDVLDEWNSSNTFAARVQNLRDGSGGNAHNGDSFLLPNILDDLEGSIDLLIGGLGSDWAIFESGEDIVAWGAEATN